MKKIVSRIMDLVIFLTSVLTLCTLALCTVFGFITVYNLLVQCYVNSAMTIQEGVVALLKLAVITVITYLSVYINQQIPD